MNAMTAPDVWSDQDRALTVEDMENMPDDESVTSWMTGY
jgi:hypothetical protein